jgi:hypothetical protein
MVCLWPPEQFISYSAAVTITGDRAADLDLNLACVAFSSDGSFTCHTCCDTGPQFILSRANNRSTRPTAGFEPAM